MNTKRSHKIFSLVMLILILGSIVASAGIGIYNVYNIKHQMKLIDEATASSAVSSEVASE